MAIKFKRKDLLLPLVFGILFAIMYSRLSLKYFVVGVVGFVGLVVILYDIKIGIIAALFTIPFLPDMISLVFIIFLLMVYFYDHLVKKENGLDSSPVYIPMILYATIIFIATITSINPVGSFRDLVIHFVSLGLVFVMINTIDKLEEFNILITFIVFSATIVALIGLYQYIVGIPIDAAWVDVENSPDVKARVYSVFANPNILAEYLIMIIPLSISLFWYTKKIHKKLIFAATSAILIVALILTLSRGGWIGFAFSALIFIILVEKRFLLSIIPIGLAGVFFLPESIMNRILSIGNLTDSSNAYRITMWKITLDIIKDHPIAGVGLGHIPFKETFESYIRTMPIYHAHNTYLEIAAELGIPGLIAFLFLLFTVFKYGVQSLISDENRYIKIMAAGVFSGLGGLLAHGMVENVIYLTRIIVYFWVLIGFILVLMKIKKQEKIHIG